MRDNGGASPLSPRRAISAARARLRVRSASESKTGAGMPEGAMTGNGSVLVTGATGFIAGHVIAELLVAGYDVRGTVRDPEHADVLHLSAIARDTGVRFDIVRATLDSDDGS